MTEGDSLAATLPMQSMLGPSFRLDGPYQTECRESNRDAFNRASDLGGPRLPANEVMTVDEYIDSVEPPLRQVAEELRRIVRQAAPDATESIKWGMPVFEHNGLLCYIGSMKRHVNLGFYRGAHLPDPHGLMEGNGKALRHVKVRDVADIRQGAFNNLVQEAVGLNAG